MPSGARAPGECRRAEPPPATALEECCLHPRPGVSFPPRPGPDALGPSRSGNSQTLRRLRRLTPAPRAPGDASPVRPLGPRGPGCPHPPAATACPPGPKGAAWDSLPTRRPLARQPETPFRRLGDIRKALRPSVRGRVESSRRRGGGGREGRRAGLGGSGPWLWSRLMSPRDLLRGGPDPCKGWRCWKLTRLSREPRCSPSSLRGGLGHRVPVDCRILRWVSQDAGKRGTSGWWALMRGAGKTRSP